MCDIYIDYCAACKRAIPMHLADFETARPEIQVFCWDCWDAVKNRYKDKRYVIWQINDISDPDVKKGVLQLYEKEKEFIGKFIVVVALTENAWKHRKGNFPNLVLELKEIKDRRESRCAC